MTAFVAVAMLITVAVIAALILPLIRRRTRERNASDQADLAAYRDRLAELLREHERGLLDERELRAAEDDLERELLQARPADSGGTNDATPARLSALVVALLVPLGGAALYIVAGEPGRLAASATDSLSRDRVQQIRSMPVEQRIETLERWVAENDDSAQGWSLLAQAYRETEAFGDAATAFARARAAGANDAWLIARQAEALLLANNRRFTRGVSRLLEESLAQDARNPLALMLSGQAALVGGEPAKAADYWRRLVDTMPEDAPQRGFIEDLVARAEAAARGESPTTRAETPTDSGTDATGPAVAVRVSVGETVAGSVQPGDTVFVFARRPNGGGPPLAVARTRAGALPQRIVLDDGDSMAPQVKLSQAERVVVTARISRSGEARARSGDLEGSSQPVTVGGETEVDVVIDRRIP
ncbi:MAG: c-type cytochrome biogenesis protein CcmI [Halofilum sp. (in: g-proteobacteria)]|nr:c-type cytochrome biogenesis protein CcmI [Halofilum sp. (in: g-proteobacteria)]